MSKQHRTDRQLAEESRLTLLAQQSESEFQKQVVQHAKLMG